jgi:hypothetical protein
LTGWRKQQDFGGDDMGWIGQFIAELYYLALGDSSGWRPRDFSAAIEEVLGDELAGLGFTLLNHTSHEKSNYFIDRVEYQSSRFKLEFFWDRQSVDGELSPLNLEIIPDDPTLPPFGIDQDSRHSSFSLWSIFEFCNLFLKSESHFLSTPGRFRKKLKIIKAGLPKIKIFVEGDLKIYIPYRRYKEIRQLEYNWEHRKSYKDPEWIINLTQEKCRKYADLWWEDEDYVSVAGVLNVIETELTQGETKRLRIARRKAKKLQREFYASI